MELKFTENKELINYYSIDEVGIDTDSVSYEHLGIIFKDELGINWKINDEYSGIIELDELKQIIKFMEEKKWN